MAYRNRNFFLTILEAEKSKIKAQADSVSGKSLLPSSETALFPLCLHMAEGTKELSGVSFIRTLIPFKRVSPL